MTTNIGKLDAIALSKNIDGIVKKINSGISTIDKEIANREHEIEMLRMYSSKNKKTIDNNKLRIRFIDMEIEVLRRLHL